MRIVQCDECRKNMSFNPNDLEYYYLNISKKVTGVSEPSEPKEFCCKECFKKYVENN